MPTASTPLIRVRVPAKINLALGCGPRRADGYHDLVTVFQAVSLYDDVQLIPNTSGRITINMTGLGEQLSGPVEDNLAYRAADLLRQTAGSTSLGADIHIDKAIPIAGGMAGGSADAAGTLVAASRAWQLNYSQDQLLELATRLGADVPFPILGGCALGLNRGDRLTPVLSRGTYHWVLAFAAEGLSTAAVFRRFDERATANPMPAGQESVCRESACPDEDPGRPGSAAGDGNEVKPDAVPGPRSGPGRPGSPAGDGLIESSNWGDAAAALPLPTGLLQALTSGDPRVLAPELANGLTAAACSLQPGLGRTMAAGLEAGALAALLSGSGPTVAFLAADATAALDIAVRLTSSGVARGITTVSGPVLGARLL